MSFFIPDKGTPSSRSASSSRKRPSSSSSFTPSSSSKPFKRPKNTPKKKKTSFSSSSNSLFKVDEKDSFGLDAISSGSESSDDELNSSSSSSSRIPFNFDVLDKEEGNEGENHLVDEKETADEKRIRMARELLNTLDAEALDDEDDDDEDREEGQVLGSEPLSKRQRIAQRLQNDALDRSKKSLMIGDKISSLSLSPKMWSGHTSPVTALALTDDEKVLFSADKSGAIFKWDVDTGTKKRFVTAKSWASKKPSSNNNNNKNNNNNNNKEEKVKRGLFSLAVSWDSKFLAAGDITGKVHIWDIALEKLVHSFTGHKGRVAALAFRSNSYTLFSGAADNTLKIWEVNQMAYMQTLYGHQAEVTHIDCLRKERPVSCSEDGSLRVWKVAEESQLVLGGLFSNKEESKVRQPLDSVTMINEMSYATGGQDGFLRLWSTGRKNACVSLEEAHGRNTSSPFAHPNPITSVKSFPFTDTFISGSHDGFVNIWKTNTETLKTITKVNQIELDGVVNSIATSKTGKFLIIGTGKNPRLGRWYNSTGRNAIHFVSLLQAE